MKESGNTFFDFIRDHSEENTSTLLLSAAKYPGIDVRLAAATIEGRRKMALKVPEWGERFDLIYPASVNVEQCSSSYTAELKQRFFKNRDVFDLTGGLGVDSYYISKVARSVIMFEQNELLCDAVQSNFRQLGTENISVVNKRIDGICDITGFSSGRDNTVYIDPSRRGRIRQQNFCNQGVRPGYCFAEGRALSARFKNSYKGLSYGRSYLTCKNASRMFRNCHYFGF
jgi:hypothetical protein